MVYFEVGLRTHAIIETIAAPFIYLIVTPISLVYHAIRYLICPPSFPNWNFRRYMVVQYRRTVRGWFFLRCTPARDPAEAKILPKEEFSEDCRVERVWCAPINPKVPRISVLSRAQDIVRPVTVPGFMIAGPGESRSDILAKADPEERIVLFIIGGAYMNGHPLGIHTPWNMAKISGARVFGINYRKSLKAESAFPAALYDHLAALQYLIDVLGFKPKNIMVSGDSAGANACLTLVRYLDELQQYTSFDWGQVGSMCLHCPWSDMTSTSPSLKTNKYTDGLIDLSLVAIPSHTRHFPDDLANPYFSPALASDSHFAHLAKQGVQVYISAGTAEAFYDQIKMLRDVMRRAGIQVTYREHIGAVHSDFVAYGRPFPAWYGWTWPVTKADFEDFWKSTA